MKITFDPKKNKRNIEERKLSFELMNDFLWNTAIIWPDRRKDYNEERFISLGMIEERLYSAAYTYRAGSIRVISFRKANKTEMKKYEKEKARSLLN